jgi:membrane protein DedA with SNARE-associated domain
VLLAIGALAGTGRIDPVVAFGAAIAGSLLADTVWYAIGRWKGPRALAWLCRISLEPDTCVAKTQGMFVRYGVKSLAVAKFVPGYDTVAPPLAGTMRVPTGAFLAWSAVGAALFVGAFAGVGLVLGERAGGAMEAMSGAGTAVGIAFAALFAGYAAWKYVQRRRVLAELRTARIAPEELHRMIVAGENPEVVDVRHVEALDLSPYAIPGARYLTLAEVEARHHEIPRDRDVVLYCT